MSFHKSIIALASILLASLGLNSQMLTNGAFEKWDTIHYYNYPNHWFSNNFLNLVKNDGKPLVKATSDAHTGDQALMLESQGGNNQVGKAFLYNPYESGLLEGGVPYTQRPDSITGFAKYEIQPRDTAKFDIVFLKNNNLLGSVTIRFFDTSRHYEFFSIPVNWFSPFDKPDTLSIAITASTEGKGPNQLILDDLRFKKGQNISKIPNGDFEHWYAIESEEAAPWKGLNTGTLHDTNQMLSRSQHAYRGKYAGLIANVKTYDQDLTGLVEQPIALQQEVPDSLTGYYDYKPKGNDSAIIGYFLINNASKPGESRQMRSNFIQLPKTNDYQPFNLSIRKGDMDEADSLIIFCSAGHINERLSGHAGSRLFLDELTLHNDQGASSSQPKSAGFQIYPNPVSSRLAIQGKHFHKTKEAKLINLQGEIINTHAIPHQSHGASYWDISHVPGGLYFIQIGNQMQKLVIRD